MYMFNIFLLEANPFYFSRQLLSNFTKHFSSMYSSFGARLLLFTVRDLKASVNKPLDFHDEIFLVLLIFLNHLFIG